MKKQLALLGTKTSPRFNRSSEWETKIKPAMQALFQACQTVNLPLICAVADLADDEGVSTQFCAVALEADGKAWATPEFAVLATLLDESVSKERRLAVMQAIGNALANNN